MAKFFVAFALFIGTCFCAYYPPPGPIYFQQQPPQDLVYFHQPPQGSVSYQQPLHQVPCYLVLVPQAQLGIFQEVYGPPSFPLTPFCYSQPGLVSFPFPPPEYQAQLVSRYPPANRYIPQHHLQSSSAAHGQSSFPPRRSFKNRIPTKPIYQPPFHAKYKSRRELATKPHSSHSISPQVIAKLKQDIFEALRSSTKSRRSSSGVSLNTFIFELSSNSDAKSLPLLTHVEWFVEFITLPSYMLSFNENINDYFDFIKSSYSIKEEIFTNRALSRCIATAVCSLIKLRCRMPEIISKFLELIQFDFLTNVAGRIDHYQALVDAILANQEIITPRAHRRFLLAIEASLKYVQIVPEIVFIDSGSYESSSLLRKTLHYAPLYKVLMGYDYLDHERERTKNLNDAMAVLGLPEDSTFSAVQAPIAEFTVLNTILQQVFLHFSSCSPEEYESHLARYYQVGLVLNSKFLNSHWQDMVSHNLFYLLDFYILFTSEQPDFSIDLFEFILLAYQTNQSDPFMALNHVAIFLSNISITLEAFQETIKLWFEEVGYFDDEFILVLEALFTAVNDIDVSPGRYLTWEPSRELLLLQEKIFDLNTDREEYQSLHADFLFFAAKIFLSRSTAHQYSLFYTKRPADGFSWRDLIIFVNFYLQKQFPLSGQTVESKYSVALEKAYAGGAPSNFETVRAVFESNPFLTTKLEAEESSA